jgi:hypothetical protein
MMPLFAVPGPVRPMDCCPCNSTSCPTRMGIPRRSSAPLKSLNSLKGLSYSDGVGAISHVPHPFPLEKQQRLHCHLNSVDWEFVKGAWAKCTPRWHTKRPFGALQPLEVDGFRSAPGMISESPKDSTKLQFTRFFQGSRTSAARRSVLCAQGSAGCVPTSAFPLRWTGIHPMTDYGPRGKGSGNRSAAFTFVRAPSHPISPLP